MYGEVVFFEIELDLIICFLGLGVGFIVYWVSLFYVNDMIFKIVYIREFLVFVFYWRLLKVEDSFLVFCYEFGFFW